MKGSLGLSAKIFLAIALLLTLTATLGTTSASADEKHDFKVAGLYVEGCSCSIPCACSMGAMRHSCHAVGAITVNSGTYNGVDLSGAKIVYATSTGDWVRLYIDTKDPGQQEAATAYAKAAYSALGKMEAVKKANIEVSGKDGRYTLTVDGGKIVQLGMEPVLGADETTPISHTNTITPFSPTVMQGKTLKGSFHDGERSFTLEGSNAYFNDHVDSSGKI